MRFPIGFRFRQWRTPVYPASKALFALTLPAAGGYLVFTAALLLQAAGGFDQAMWLIPAAIFSGLLLTAGTQLLFFYHGLCRERFPECRRRNFVPMALAAALLVSACLCLTGTGFRAAALPALWLLFFGWVLPLPLALRTSRSAVAAALLATPCFAAGAALLSGSFHIPWAAGQFFPIPAVLHPLPDSFSDARLAFIALPLLLAAYLLWAKLFAELRNRPFRRVFGTGTWVLWGLVLAAYPVSAAFSASAAHRLEAARFRLEQRFGRPLTTEAFRKLHLAGQQPDPAYWEELYQAQKSAGESALPEKWETWQPGRFSMLPAPEAAEYAALLKRIDFSRLDQLADRKFPKDDRLFSRKSAAAAAPGALSQLARLGFRRAWAELRQGRLDEARRQERRMYRIANRLCGGSSLLDNFHAVAVENIRLDLWELMLESGRLTDAELKNFSRELEKQAPSYARTPEKVWYAVAVETDDILTRRYGDFPPPDRNGAPPYFGTVNRLLLPQYHSLLLADHARMLEDCMALGVAGAPLPDRPNSISGGLFSLNDLERNMVRQHRRLLARFRAERALIAAELHFRKTGAWPEKPDPLPEDPFTGEPLRYRVGSCRIDRNTEANAVQVWSAGPDRRDDGGASGFSEADGAAPDDIRAIRRLP